MSTLPKVAPLDRLTTPEIAGLLARVLVRGSECADVLSGRLSGRDAARVRACRATLDAAAAEVVAVLERLAAAEAGPRVH